MAQATSKRSPKRKRKPGDTGGNQGEGNREADRLYREKAKEFAESGRVRPAAEDARRSIEGGEHERDAGVSEEFDQLARDRRALREELEGDPLRGRDDTDESDES